MLLEIENLEAIQWIQGAGKPLPSRWLDMLGRIQKSGKSIQLYYGPNHGDDANLIEELDILCDALDPTKLFIWAIVDTVKKADILVEHARKICG